jgi:hypothetical protein
VAAVVDCIRDAGDSNGPHGADRTGGYSCTQGCPARTEAPVKGVQKWHAGALTSVNNAVALQERRAKGLVDEDSTHTCTYGRLNHLRVKGLACRDHHDIGTRRRKHPFHSVVTFKLCTGG